MSFKVKFVNGEEKEFEGDVHKLSAASRTAVAAMVELKVAGEKNPVYVSLDHILYAQATG
ncbi:MAG TPA: hypothetical protein VFC31_13500 [Candidatus Limnocylindria bacterium]|nr:hypothetical protein [Candidatus Limnocylindria bacterium]